MTRSVLVAESDATELELIATVLARDGFRVLQALEREQAMQLFASEEIALVIAASDVSGRGGGAVLCGEVKKLQASTRVVILHPSGNDPDARSVLLARTGCDAVLPSPFRYDALKRLLGEWGLAAPPRQSAPMSFAVPPPDLSTLVAAPSVPDLSPEPASQSSMSPMPVPPPVTMSTPIEPAASQAPVPIPIPVVFPASPPPDLAEYSGDAKADEAQPGDTAGAPVAASPPSVFDTPGAVGEADGSFAASFAELTVDAAESRSPGPEDREPIAEDRPPILAAAALDDEPTVRVGALDALTSASAMDDEPTVRAAAPDTIENEQIVPAEGAHDTDDEPTLRASALAALADEPARDDTVHDRLTVEIPNPSESATPEQSVHKRRTLLISTPVEGSEDWVDDRVTVEIANPGESPPLSASSMAEVIAESTPAAASSAAAAATPQDPVRGDWLLAPPAQEQDGFAGIDLSGGIDSALDHALGDSPAARVDVAAALSDEAARSVALAVQAYVAESLALGDEPPTDPEAPPLPPAADFAAEPAPVPQASTGDEPPAPASMTDEPPPFLPASAPDEPPAIGAAQDSSAQPTSAWQMMEPGAGRFEAGDADADAALADLGTASTSAWEVREPPPLASSPPGELDAVPAAELESAAPPAQAEPLLAEPSLPPPPPAEVVQPPPPPTDADRVNWAAKGASSWSPGSLGQANLKALEFKIPGAPEPAARAPASAAAPPAASSPSAPFPAPPPPPPEALDEPPALPFEAIVQRTPIGSEPRTTLPPSVPPEGDLSTTPLPRLLFELYGGTYCGTLRLSRKGVDRIIDVWNGFPVAVTVSPADEDDDLATLLRDHGRITPEQYDDAKRRADGREAQLLVALGIIDERDLLDAIREQTEQRLAASFSWRDGTYKITPSRAPPDSVVLSEVHPVKIIWRGVCEHYDVGSLLAFFSPLRARFIVATEVFPIHYETIGPFLRRVGVAPLLDGRTTFEQALRSDDSHALTIAHTLYVLIVTEMIRAQSKPGEAAKFPDAQAATRQSKPVDYRELTRVCEEVARTYLTLKGHDYFTMLQLSRQATEKEVAAAYDRLAKPFKLENLLPGLPDDVQRRAREIDQLLRRARDTLSSPEERRRYVIRLEENQPPPPPADAMAS